MFTLDPVYDFDVLNLSDVIIDDHLFSCMGHCGDRRDLPCSCEKLCKLYGNCCEDFHTLCQNISEAASETFKQEINSHLDIECTYTMFYVVSSCPLDIDDDVTIETTSLSHNKEENIGTRHSSVTPITRFHVTIPPIMYNDNRTPSKWSFSVLVSVSQDEIQLEFNQKYFMYHPHSPNWKHASCKLTSPHLTSNPSEGIQCGNFTCAVGKFDIQGTCMKKF